MDEGRKGEKLLVHLIRNEKCSSLVVDIFMVLVFLILISTWFRELGGGGRFSQGGKEVLVAY
jgi:hypothetical protein